MKKKIISLVLIFLLLGYLSFKAANKSQYWLRTEDNGIVYHVDYLHELCKKQPAKAKQYLGKKISFVARFCYAEDNLVLDYYGKIPRALTLASPTGRAFLVADVAKHPASYQKGELLKVSGKITEIKPNCIYLLDVAGCCAWPNEIIIEKIKP